MNDPAKKTASIPMSEIKRAYGEAVDDTADATPIVIKDGKIEKAEDAADAAIKDGMVLSLKDVKNIRILPPIDPKYAERYTNLGFGRSVMDKVMERTREVAQAEDMLVAVGFLPEQTALIRKAICKKDAKKIEAYKKQFRALYFDSTDGVGGWPIRCEEKWKTICDLFTKDNPLKCPSCEAGHKPTEYFAFYEDNSIHLLKATAARKAAIQKANTEMAELLDIPKAKTVTCIKPGPGEPMKIMHGVSQGIEPTFQKSYFRNVVPARKHPDCDPASLDYREAVRAGHIKEREIYRVGDFVEIIDGEHKGKAAQVRQIANESVVFPATGKGKWLDLNLVFWEGSVTCHECQVTKLPEAADFRRYDRVKLMFGSSEGQFGTVTRVGAQRPGPSDNPWDDQPWVFVMLDSQKPGEHPCGFDAFKLALVGRTCMPKPCEEITYYENGIESHARTARINIEYDSGDVGIEVFEAGQIIAQERILLGDIPRLLSWLGKRGPDFMYNGPMYRRQHTGFPVFDEFLKNKPEAAGSMYDILAEPVLKFSKPNSETMAEREEWKSFYDGKKTEPLKDRFSKLPVITHTDFAGMERMIAAGEYERVFGRTIVMLTAQEFDKVRNDQKYQPILDRMQAENMSAYTVRLSPKGYKDIKTGDVHYRHGPDKPHTIIIDMIGHRQPTDADLVQMANRQGRAQVQDIIVEGMPGLNIERPGPVTVDTRGIDPDGGTVVLKGRCICDVAVLSVSGCKCGQPVVPEVQAEPEAGACTCPMSALFSTGHLPNCPHKKG